MLRFDHDVQLTCNVEIQIENISKKIIQPFPVRLVKNPKTVGGTQKGNPSSTPACELGTVASAAVFQTSFYAAS